MPESQPPESGTLVIAALLVLALLFAGSWVVVYASPGGDPWALIPRFVGAAGALIALGIVVYLIRGRRR
jgi:hypothetical protein